MFGIFKKKEMNISAAKSFWDWYLQHDALLTNKMKSPTIDIIYLIDSQLSPVFPYFKDMQFEVGGYKDGKYEFILFHCGNKNLARDAETLKNMMPNELSDHIIFKIEESRNPKRMIRFGI